MRKQVKGVEIIGGADGPTSIFIAGKTGKLKISERIKCIWRQKKRKRAEKKIIANPHTLEEVVTYIEQNYHAVEISHQTRRYQLQKDCLKESLIMKHCPELLGEMANINRPEQFDESSLREFQKQLELRSQKAHAIGDETFSMNYHLYDIRYPDKGEIEIEIENNHKIISISYSGNRRAMKQLSNIAKDIYLYYGVSKEDIDNRTERYSSLVLAMCS